MSGVEDVVNKFNILDDMLKQVYSKVDPLLVVSLIFDRKCKQKIYLHYRGYNETRLGH